MKQFTEIDSCRVSLGHHVFVYALTCLSFSNASGKIPFAAISSDDSLMFFEFSSSPTIDVNGMVKNAHVGITCMIAASSSNTRKKPITAGRDGLVKIWDPHGRCAIREFKTPNGEAISAMSFSAERRHLVAGTELKSDPPGDVAIYLWDLADESTSQPQRVYSYSHNDTVTALLFSGLNSTYLISASTDGLVTLFDTAFSDEDDAVQTVLNNRSAVHHLLNVPSRSNSHSEDVCTISHDERLAFLSLSEEPDAADGAAGGWDVREGLNGDYAIKLQANPRPHAEGVALCVGANKPETRQGPCIYICTVRPAQKHVKTTSLAQPPPETTTLAELGGAHGEEVVRDVWFHDECPYIITCGEDGCIRVWGETSKPPHDGISRSANDPNANPQATSPKEKKTSKKHRRSSSGAYRFKPY